MARSRRLLHVDHVIRAADAVRLCGALALAMVMASLFVAGSTAWASTTSADSSSVFPTSGPVGTEVHLSGDMGPCPQLGEVGGQPTAFLEFQRGSGGLGQPNEWINVPVAPNGTWSATFVIASFVGGLAMTQGSQGGNVTPGSWSFGLPSCTSAAPEYPFTVTSSAPLSRTSPPSPGRQTARATGWPNREAGSFPSATRPSTARFPGWG